MPTSSSRSISRTCSFCSNTPPSTLRNDRAGLLRPPSDPGGICPWRRFIADGTPLQTAAQGFVGLLRHPSVLAHVPEEAIPGTQRPAANIAEDAIPHPSAALRTFVRIHPGGA